MSTSDQILKRMFDIVMAAIGLLPALPLIGLCWVVAAIETRSNGFFIQKRIGRHGRVIHVCKIKTMYPGDAGRSPIASRNAACITGSGKFFRKYKLDELPQLFNVLAGSMSFVGPRPDVPGYADQLQGSDRVILQLRPGITGPASIKYKDEEDILAAVEDPVAYNDQVIWPDKVRLNKDYIRSYSLMRDMHYILQTLFSEVHMSTPGAGWPHFSDEEASAVKDVILSNKVNYWTGSECREFEKEFAAWVGTRYAVSLSNGTLALDSALRALGIGAGDEVIVAPRTFLASASCIVNAGAVPVFADVDRDSQNITAAGIAAVLTPRTRAVICVHLAGWPCDMDPIMELAQAQGFYVIEDCAQAHGARYKGRAVGSIGHIGAWSFCQDKIMTTGGEGGMVTTNRREWWQAMWSYKDHGKSWEAVYERQHPPGYRWVHESLGTNWRMLEVQAAIGRIQLRRMPGWSAQRRANAARLATACSSIEALRVPVVPSQIEHAYYRFYAFVDPALLAPGWSRDRIMEEISAGGVVCTQGTCPEIYLEKAFDGTGCRPGQRLPVARELGETSLMFLVHPTLGEAELALAGRVIGEVFARAQRRIEATSTCPG